MTNSQVFKVVLSRNRSIWPLNGRPKSVRGAGPTIRILQSLMYWLYVIPVLIIVRHRKVCLVWVYSMTNGFDYCVGEADQIIGGVLAPGGAIAKTIARQH